MKVFTKSAARRAGWKISQMTAQQISILEKIANSNDGHIPTPAQFRISYESSKKSV